MVYLVIGDGLVGEDALVYERLQLCRFNAKVLKRAERRVVLMADKTQEKMVRAYSVTACAHGFFTRVFNDLVEVFRYL